MTHPVSRHAALTSLALAIAAPAALAQTVAEKPLESILVTATRSPQLASDILSDTISISSDEIARTGAGSLTDLLQKQRGIEVARNGGPGTTTSVFIRGANSNQNIVLVDGVRIGSSTTGTANWGAIPLSAIDHIEIVYGPLATMYGADAIGGVIQIFTKKGAGAPQMSAAIGAGNNTTRTYEASVSGATSDEHVLSYALTAGKDRSGGFSATVPGNSSYNADRDGYDRQSATGRLALQVAKGHEIGLLASHSQLDAQYDNGSSSYDARTSQTLDNTAFFSNNQWTSNWHSTFQLSEARDEQYTDSSAAASGKSQINTTQNNLSWQNDIRLGSDTLQVLLERREEKVTASTTPALDGERATNSIATSYNLKRGAHLASVSLRNDDSSQYGNKATGAVGYGYHIDNALRASASVSTSFREPTFNELYYPNYGVASNKPEKGRNFETGLYFDDGKTQWSAVYFRNRLTDLLVSASVCPVSPETHPYGCSYNVDRALLEGITLAAARQLGNFKLSANLDLQNPRDETTGNTLARRAKKHANLALGYGTGALHTGVDLQVSGKRFDDAANQNTLGAYALLGLYATYQLAPQWSLLTRWSNVTDKNYALAKNYATPGSTIFVSLRYASR
jgi:vitamin B12 transporter